MERSGVVEMQTRAAWLGRTDDSLAACELCVGACSGPDVPVLNQPVGSREKTVGWWSSSAWAKVSPQVSGEATATKIRPDGPV
jgi:hypothetical protein